MSESARTLQANFFTLLALDTKNIVVNFDFNSILGPSKDTKNLSVHTKMVMFTKVNI